MPQAFEIPTLSLTVDCVVFGLDAEQEDLKILLIQRAIPPFEGKWALPGGFVRPGEAIEQAAFRELKEETGLEKVYLEQLFTFGDPRRDPRARIVTVAYYALVNLNEHTLKATTDARSAAWFSVNDVPELAFDHARIVEVALKRLKGKLRYEPIGFELLPKKFTMPQLQTLYELVLERRLDRRNFRKKILGMGLLVELDEVKQDSVGRAAKLYQFDERKYRKLKQRGFNFEV